MKRTILLALTILISLPSFAQNIDEQKKKKERIEDEIHRIDRQLNANKDKKKASVNTLVLTQKKIQNRKNLIARIDKDIDRIDQDMAACDVNIARLNARLDTLIKYHSDMVQNAYKVRDTKIWLMYILTGKDISQSLRRWSYLKNISISINSQATKIKSTMLSLEIEKTKKQNLKLESIVNKNARTKEYDHLLSEEKKVNQMISKLSKEEKKMRAELKKKQKEVDKLNKEIERILAETIKGKGQDKAPITDYKLSSKFAENKGKLPWPVKDGIITEKFGQSFHPVFKNLKLPFNNGINISCPSGNYATSVFDGVVKQILIMPGYNQCVLVQHGEYFTFYCKLKKTVVKSGDKIKTGDNIGIIGDNEDGNAELHFQLWKGTTKQNPEHWLR